MWRGAPPPAHLADAPGRRHTPLTCAPPAAAGGVAAAGRWPPCAAASPSDCPELARPPRIDHHCSHNERARGTRRPPPGDGYRPSEPPERNFRNVARGVGSDNGCRIERVCQGAAASVTVRRGSDRARAVPAARSASRPRPPRRHDACIRSGRPDQPSNGFRAGQRLPPSRDKNPATTAIRRQKCPVRRQARPNLARLRQPRRGNPHFSRAATITEQSRRQSARHSRTIRARKVY